MLDTLQRRIKRAFQMENWLARQEELVQVGTHQRMTLVRLLEQDFRSYRLRLMAGLQSGSFTHPRYVEIARAL